MRLINLSGSTLLAAIGYDHKKRIFVAQFHRNGKFFAYAEVPMDHFVFIITDPVSQGKAFNALVKGSNRPYIEMTAEEVEKL